mmetsp:Transcript_1728/g.1172  ORF Transcript_1728/g.1172 Transcript_1728/m.1172 type:complete len:119 (-) Transcript_1728:642-998(-)
MEVDSNLIKNNWKSTSQFMITLYDKLIKGEGSPYKEKGTKIDLNEFLWAWSTVSTRGLTLNNTHADPQDLNLVLMIMPLLDYINHSSTPNSIALPVHDKLLDTSFVEVRAIRDIAAGE